MKKRTRNAASVGHQLRIDGGIEILEGPQKGLFRIIDMNGQFRGHVVEGREKEPYSWMVLIEGEKLPFHASNYEDSQKLATQLIFEQDRQKTA